MVSTTAAGHHHLPRCKTRDQMKVHHAAAQGIARTFQNIALFKGMSTLDNIMTGRNLKIKSNMLQQAIYWGKAQKRRSSTAKRSRRLSTFWRFRRFARPRSANCRTACKAG